MWMVEGNDHGKELKMFSDPMYGRKLRPLMPRPISSCSSKTSPFSTISTPSCCCIHNPNILPWNHPISGLSDYGVKKEMPLVSTRWNPTPEQLHALEEMYRRGTRTPSAEQIQQIAAKLRRFGKIEGKNVFYWFQNHKARERQKRRRQLELLAGKKIHHVETTLETKQTGLSRKYLIEHHKNLATPSNCSTPSEDSVSMHGAVMAECKQDEWTQLHQKELQQKNETSWKLDLSSCLFHTTALVEENLDERGIKENQTLQLFPVRSIDSSTLNDTHLEEEIHDVSTIGTKFTPNEFIEFLPTKH